MGYSFNDRRNRRADAKNFRFCANRIPRRQSTNKPIAAATIRDAVRVTAARHTGELQWFLMIVALLAIIKIPVNRKGASNPLKTAAQKSAFTGLTSAKSRMTPITVERM